MSSLPPPVWLCPSRATLPVGGASRSPRSLFLSLSAELSSQEPECAHIGLLEIHENTSLHRSSRERTHLWVRFLEIYFC